MLCTLILIKGEQETVRSATKYLQENDDESSPSSNSSDEDRNEQVISKPKKGNYVEIKHVGVEDDSDDEGEEQPVHHKPKRSTKRSQGDKSQPVEYVELKSAPVVPPVIQVQGSSSSSANKGK